MIVTLFKLLSVILNLCILIIIGKQISKRNFSLFFLLTIVFEVFFVLPIFLDIVVEEPNLEKYKGFYISQKDQLTNIIYTIFVSIVPYIFYFEGKKTARSIGANNIQEICNNFLEKVNLSKVTILGLSLLSLLPVWLALFSPRPQNYFFDFAHFFNNTDAIGYEYHTSIMYIGLYIALISVLILKLFSKKNDLFSNYIVIVSIFFILWFCGKRTLPSLAIMGIVMINIIRLPKGKTIWKDLFAGGFLIIAFFFLYIMLTDKRLVGLDSYDVMRVYFGRDDEVKMAIYSLLYPDKMKILDFWGQSYLFILTFFIPRSIWPNKPWPYATYFTSSLVGLESTRYLGWHMTTSWFGESIANFGWFGFLIGVWLFIKFIKISEKRDSVVVVVISTVTLSMLMVLQFSANLKFIFIWILSLIIFNNKKKKQKSIKI